MKIVTILILLFLVSCTSNNNTNETSNEISDNTESVDVKPIDISFENYLLTLQNIELPYKLDCNTQFEYTNKIPESLSKIYKEPGGTPYGMFQVFDSIYAIIYMFAADIYLPVLYTYDNEGNSISKLQLLDKLCASDVDYKVKEFTEILSDFSIICIDSINASGNLDIVQTNYSISQIGKITIK